MTLDELYRDVYSRIGMLQLEHPIYEMDIIKAINDACVLIRAEYLKAGRYDGFVVKEDVYVTVPDYYHPYLNYHTLEKAIAPELSAQEAVVAATAQLITSQLSNTALSVTIGQERVKTGDIYKAVSASGSVNAYNLTFTGRVRKILENDDLKYKTGDIVVDVDGTYWKIKTNFTNTGITIGNATYFDEVFYQYEQTNFVTPIFYSFDRLANLKLISDMDDQIGFSVLGDKLYTTQNAGRFVIEYIPEWVDVTDRDEELPITRTMAGQVKQETLRLLEYKVGKQLTDNRLKQDAK